MSLENVINLRPQVFFSVETFNAIATETNYPKELIQVQKTWQEIGVQAGSPERLVAPGGGFDIFPLFMDSAKLLVIMDMLPLLRSNQQDSPNGYSSHIHSILADNKNTYMSLEAIGRETVMTEDAISELYKDIGTVSNESINVALGHGFKRMTETMASSTNIDYFSRILATLVVMGVDLHSLQIGSFDNGYRFRFNLDGKDKFIFFKNVKLDQNLDRRDSQEAQALRNCFGEFTKGRTAVIGKATDAHITKYVINVLEPDSIIGEEFALGKPEDLQDRYDVAQIQTPTYPDRNWGHIDVFSILIGNRKIKKKRKNS